MQREQVVAALEKRKRGGRLTRAELGLIARWEAQREAERRDEAYRQCPQAEFCALLGVSRKTFRDWEAAGMPVRREPGRRVNVDLNAVLPWLRQRWTTGDGGEMTKTAAQIKVLVHRAALYQIKERIMTGELLERDQVAQAEVEQITAVRAGLEALGRSLAPAILELGPEATVDEAERLVWDYVEPLLRAFAGDRAAEVLDGASDGDD